MQVYIFAGEENVNQVEGMVKPLEMMEVYSMFSVWLTA